jgi:hypothetical protein
MDGNGMRPMIACESPLNARATAFECRQSPAGLISGTSGLISSASPGPVMSENAAPDGFSAGASSGADGSEGRSGRGSLIRGPYARRLTIHRANARPVRRPAPVGGGGRHRGVPTARVQRGLVRLGRGGRRTSRGGGPAPVPDDERADRRDGRREERSADAADAVGRDVRGAAAAVDAAAAHDVLESYDRAVTRLRDGWSRTYSPPTWDISGTSLGAIRRRPAARRLPLSRLGSVRT